MATKVHMEALSPTMEEGQIVRWLKAEGDPVANGDIIAEIETDKATMELVARGDGILRAILQGPGSTAPVGQVIGVIADADEDIGDLTGAAGGGEASAPEAPAAPASEAPPAPAAPVSGGPAEGASAPAPAEAAPAPAAAASEGGRVKASPVARRLAADAGVDLGAVMGSGPGGRIVKKDVEAAAAAPPAAPAPAGAPAATLPAAGVGAFDGPDFEDLPLSQMRKTIARRLTESIGPVPHFFLTVEVDMGRVLEARKSVNGILDAYGSRISVNDMILRAVAGALRLHPAVNSAWMGDTIRQYNRVHIGVAVAVEDGLITPIVRDADRKGLAQIGQEVRELAGRAREKRLLPEEYTGSTFSISNLGMMGIQEFTAVINPPEAAILAVGGVEEIPVAVEGEVVIRPRMKMTLSCDHRVIDGATGAQFLATLKGMLEEPAAILI